MSDTYHGLNRSSISGVCAACVAVAVVAGCGDATSTEDLGERQTLGMNTTTQAIQGGSVDSSTKSIVGLTMQRGGGSGICSGTLIGENVVLTARHCVSELSSSRGVRCGSTTFTRTLSASDIRVTTETRMRSTRNWMGVDQIYTTPGSGVCGNDLAIIQLDTSVPQSTAKPRRPRIRNRVTRGTGYTAYGYGTTGTRGTSGTRRTIDNRQVQCVGSNCYGQVADEEFSGDGGVCQGDSGGGALDSQGRVIGAASRAGRNCSSSIYAGVYKWKDWIKKTTSKAANQGGATPPNWTDPGPDSDGDGVSDKYDNCPQTANKDQTDTDGDGEGDACDKDDDSDGVPDSKDNCPKTKNPNQGDADGDGKGNACDKDSDDDGIEDGFDNCPTTPNPEQTITEADGEGDACDPDDDGDGVEDKNDNCPKTENPGQKDSDGDGLGDACDDKDGMGGENDRDGDQVKDSNDNCPDTKNSAQTDADGDGKGDACDPKPQCNVDTDSDCDTIPDGKDNCPNTKNAGQKDSDGDGTGDACDSSNGNASGDSDDESDTDSDSSSSAGAGNNDQDDDEEVVILDNNSDSPDHACGASATGSPQPSDLAGFLLMALAFGFVRLSRRD